jgi:glutamate synthase (NADPH/NADH) large chain
VVETGSAREVHHFALLAGYGAEAIHPYLAMETLAGMAKGLSGDLSPEKAIYNYPKALGKGLMKVFSKMGISTYMSYCGAQIFEAIGLSRALVDKYFRGTASNVEGIGVFEVAEEAVRLHTQAFGADPVLADMLDAPPCVIAASVTAAAPQRGPRHRRLLEELSLAAESRRIVLLEGTTRS